jgi:hypothetical protein
MLGASSNDRRAYRRYQLTLSTSLERRPPLRTNEVLTLWPPEQLLTAAGGRVTHTLVEFASVGREGPLHLNLHGDKQCN